MGPASTDRGAVHRVAAYDFGIKRNILRLLADTGIEATVFPAETPATRIAAEGFDGVFLSNGPGDPAATAYGIAATRDLLGKVPLFGICLGHQLLGLALGGRTYKMTFGHRGVNQPVKHVRTGAVEITSHNHGFAVDPRDGRRIPTARSSAISGASSSPTGTSTTGRSRDCDASTSRRSASSTTRRRRPAPTTRGTCSRTSAT